MRRMNLILIVLSITLTSCKMPETEVERCVQSIKYYKCRCHNYEITSQHIGRVGASYDKPFEYCDNLVGFKPSNWAVLRGWMNEVQRKYQRD